MRGSLEAMEKDPKLDKAKEGEGGHKVQRPCQRSEVREEGLGSGISHRDSGSQTSAQHTQGCGGAYSALDGPSGKESKRDRVGVSMYVVHGERKLQNLSFCLD